MTNDGDPNTYVVVINDEEQYSIWRADRAIPAGWRDEGTRGDKTACLEHIGRVWTDMRPLSIRRAAEASPPAAAAPTGNPPARSADSKNELVARLESEQPIVLVGRPHASVAELNAQLSRGAVVVAFERTGTELCIKLAGNAAERPDGRVALEGALVLNYNRVRFVGELDRETLRGAGRLVFEGVAP